jgi:SAM-dependent methyltransferase
LTEARGLLDFYNTEGLDTERYSGVRFWTRRYHVTRMRVIERLVERYLSGSASFVDVGCGTGEYVEFAKQRRSFAIGGDLSMRYLLRCRSKGLENLITMDVTHLPIKTSSVDSVLCSEVIEHIPEMQKAVDELFRISRETLIITTPNFGVFRTWAKLLSGGFLDRLDTGVGHIHILPMGGLARLFVRKGWEQKERFSLHVAPPLLDEVHIPPVLAPAVGVLESFLNRALKYGGNISLICCEHHASSI